MWLASTICLPPRIPMILKHKFLSDLIPISHYDVAKKLLTAISKILESCLNSWHFSLFSAKAHAKKEVTTDTRRVIRRPHTSSLLLVHMNTHLQMCASRPSSFQNKDLVALLVLHLFWYKSQHKQLKSTVKKYETNQCLEKTPCFWPHVKMSAL